MRGARVIAAILIGGLLASGVLLGGCATGTTATTPLTNGTTTATAESTTTTLTPPETPSSGDHPDTTAATFAPIPDTTSTTSLTSETPPLTELSPAEKAELDGLSPQEVVRTFFASSDYSVQNYLGWSTVQQMVEFARSRVAEQPGDITKVVITPVAGATSPFGPLSQWVSQLIFTVSYDSAVANLFGRAAGKNEASVVVAETKASGPWKLLTIIPGASPRALPADEQRRLDALGSAETVRAYFLSGSFDEQYYLSGPAQRGSLLFSVRETEKPSDISNFVVGVAHAPISQDVTPEWPIVLDYSVTYVSKVKSLTQPAGERIWFVSVGRQKSDSPWKILSVGSGP